MNNDFRAIIEPYLPRSWFDPDGARIVAARLMERCPNLEGKLFITLEVDPWQFADGAEATNVTRNRIRELFRRLREGVTVDQEDPDQRVPGKRFQSRAHYLVKVEFGSEGEMAQVWGEGVSDYPHYHIVLNTRRFIPWQVIQQLWTCGNVNVKRIDSHEEGIRYLLKYAFKPGHIPEHILGRKRFRVVQSSRGFLKPDPHAPRVRRVARLRKRAREHPPSENA